MQLIAIFISLILIGEVIASKEHADEVAVDPSPWLRIINGPVLILLTKEGCIEVVLRYLNNLYDKCRDHDEARRNVEQFALAHVLEGQEEAGEHEPDVVGEVPRRLNTVVLLAPRHNVVNHEDVEKPRVLTSVTFYHLVEAWPCTTK